MNMRDRSRAQFEGRELSARLLEKRVRRVGLDVRELPVESPRTSSERTFDVRRKRCTVAVNERSTHGESVEERSI